MDNILIVDDFSFNVKMLMRILKQRGYNVRNALSGELALQSVREMAPDVILLNINIPDIDGYHVCEILKADENLKDIPIIFISECYETIDKDKVFTVGGVDYITMPFNDREVFTRIETQLKLRALQLEFKKSHDEMKKFNEELIKVNTDLENKVLERTQQLEEITEELKEFNIILEEEIAERTKTEEALKESERQFRYSLEEAPLPVMLYTEDGKIKKLNRTWTDITGYTIKDIPTTSELAKISDVFFEDLERTTVNRLFNLEKRQNDGEYSIRTRDGNFRIWDFYSAYIGKLQDGHKLFMRVAIDITERKHMEELQKNVDEERKRLNEIKEYDRIIIEFFSNISHELRTPINVIFSALQVHELRLKDCEFPNAYADIFKYTKIMKQNCYRLLRLVNNLIDITKIDSGYLDINEINSDIISLVEDITTSVADYIENKGLSLIFDTEVEEKIIACDPEKIERIILNLLSNAVKFTPCGGNIMVNIEDGIENICIRVKDTGRGIPADKLNSIFERFIQVDKSLARDHEGSGLGLSIVKYLVELHDGTISVKSKEGYGTEFIIYIPCKLVGGEVSNDITYISVKSGSCIEKTNIEFSDIYN
ncbi:sensor histidine kinase TmoS [Clostridium homopropionicum DSM 5847]|uniref:Stage 0 sporulation protein A homolog n=1 Tax=Clostridium homopropionicum DSM 5847 TaxID=1121318 RepID=A0A0L6Z6V8_9CLOT|nr:ATP-binding protein [Clostridium homopropionicum]KOA18691.1 sensor histidine kinase TmoS [Clostridium homopropionicum DSM 5847]SFG52827.1 PAS domain S-box-containing protein [Clostridium homopropionicum]